MYNQIIKIKDIVKNILIEYPKTKDNDRLLILKVWKEQHPNLINISFKQFAEMYLNKQFKDTESIRRSRQKIQEQHPELKGKLAEIRQQEEELMRTSITELTT